MTTAATTAASTTISVVIPVYDEPDWIAPCVDAVIGAFDASPFAALEVIVVDDGSAAPTRAAIAAISGARVRVIHQENRGRFAARETGIRAAVNDLVFLVDARVIIDRDALRFVAASRELAPWNGHVHVVVRGNPFGRFWNTLTAIAFFDYFGAPRTTRFDADDFDRFPKGTGCFLVRRDELLGALDRFETMFTDTRHASDDTALLRDIAARTPINISPGFACAYHARTGLVGFLRHAHHRGIHLVDGYLVPGARFRWAVLAFPPVSLVAVLLLICSRWARVAAAAAVPAAAIAVGVHYRRGWADRAALALLGPPWLVAYGLGIWRGLALARRGASGE
jgi:glycosyltransferase involved in cell wall biosynthesis